MLFWLIGKNVGTAKIKSRVYLSLGSNIGNRKQYLEEAFRELQKILECLRVSRIYETAPMYEADQNAFLNCAVTGLFDGSAENLLNKTRKIEKLIGRTKTYKNGPRKIDIDILLYENRIINKKNLIIPHPKMAQRRFVLVPLAELEPDLRNPCTDILFSEILLKIEPQGVYFHSDSRYT